MPLDRIAAVSLATPVRDLAGTDRQPTARQPPQADAPFSRASAVEDLASTALDVGDVLLVKVLGIKPELELALLDTGDRTRQSTSAPERDQPAMRSDQLAWQRQLVSRPPEAIALAASWRSTMLDQLEQQALQQQHADVRDARAQPSAFGAEADADLARQQAQSSALYKPPAYKPALEDAQRWLLTGYAWGGLRVLLRLLAVDGDAVPPHQRRSRAVAIRLALVLTDLGGVVVQLQLAPGGVLLDFAVERAQSVQALRDKLPTVMAAVARAELRVLRCRVAGGLLGEASAHAPSAAVASTAAAAALGLMRLVQSHPTPAAALPLDLFRAAAEVVLALSSL